MLFHVNLMQLWPSRWHLPAPARTTLTRLTGLEPSAPDSIIIPCTGPAHIAEAALAARFAAQHSPKTPEILIVTDQSASAFPHPTDPRIHIQTLQLSNLPIPGNHPHERIWRSRIAKLRAPLQATGNNLLMIDSDLLLLQPVQIPFLQHTLTGTLYRGKIGHRMRKHLATAPWLRHTPRLWCRHHINGGFLAATRSTWQILAPAWESEYNRLWNALPSETPVDQIPLVVALDQHHIRTANLGPWFNWSIPKRLGNLTAPVPERVIGAHGGFPLDEWDAYLADRRAPRKFRGEDYTRKARYQS